MPARLVVYYVLAMALFSTASYEEVMRMLVEGLSWESGWARRWTVPTKGAIFLARDRLGVEPLAALFARSCVPLATRATPGGFYRGWRVMAVDGSTLDVADTEENAMAFGRPGSGRGERSAFPQLRLVALAECGTHAITAASMGAYSVGEATLARDLLPRLDETMLVLADRYYAGFPLWSAAAATGAQLCWRVKQNSVFPVLDRLPDGSFVSEIVGTADKRAREHVLPVRIIQYSVDDTGRPGAAQTTYRLVTTILDPTAAPAEELAALYAQRWEIETTLDELKTHAKAGRLVLRSKTPDGVRQETYGYLCLHYAIRALMSHVAGSSDIDPDRVSFTRSLRAARRSVRAGIGITIIALQTALARAITEISREPLPVRRLRAAARVVKRKMSNFNLKRAEHAAWPQPTRPIGEGIQILAPP